MTVKRPGNADIRDVLREAEEVLALAIAGYETLGNTAQAAEFHELRVQAAIFNYDVCREIASLEANNPKGFALNVTLKDIVHKLYEYDRALSGRLVKRVLSLAQVRGIEISSAGIRNERKRWREQLLKLQNWSDVRNQVSGHYGSDISRQVRLLKQLDRKEVLTVAQAFLSLNITVLTALAAAGHHGVT